MNIDLSSKIKEKYPEIYEIASAVRKGAEIKYGKDLTGKCYITADIITQQLNDLGFYAKSISGYCWFNENLDGLTDTPSETHIWTEVTGLPEGILLYIDVTADQFNRYLSEKFPTIFIGHVPDCMNRGEPSDEYLNSINW